MHAEDLVQTHKDFVITNSVTVNPYEPCFVDFVGYISLVFFTSLVPIIFLLVFS